MVLYKTSQFFHLFILGKIGQDNVFHDILETKKKSFLNYKNKKFQRLKYPVFSKGVIPCCLSKIRNFSIFFLYFWKIGNLFHDILERTNAILQPKNKKF